jgi:hypothetical protein
MKKTGRTLGSEISGVLLTGLGKFLVADWLGLRLIFIAAACLFWLGFVVQRTRADPSVLSAWGFTTRGLRKSTAWLFPFAVLALIVTVAWGMLSGHLLIRGHLALIVLLYPAWGLVQQFLVVALIAGNLEKHTRLPSRGIVILTALVFAAVHVPSVPLVMAAFVIAVITTTVYFRARNLWALGVFHGWVATCLYYFVLGQDPWREVLSTWIGS